MRLIVLFPLIFITPFIFYFTNKKSHLQSMHVLVSNSTKYQLVSIHTHKIVNYHKALLELNPKVVGKENKNACSTRWRRHWRKWKIRVALTNVEKSLHQTIRENSNIQYSLRKSIPSHQTTIHHYLDAWSTKTKLPFTIALTASNININAPLWFQIANMQSLVNPWFPILSNYTMILHDLLWQGKVKNGLHFLQVWKAFKKKHLNI